MLLRFTGLLLFILFVSFPVSISKVIEAHVKVINAKFYNDITNQTTACSPFTLKLGYCNYCPANHILSPGNRFEYDYGSKCEFNTSTPIIFTRGFEKTDKYIVLVVVMDETLKTKKFTSCGQPPDNSQIENGNSTIVHTESYFTGHHYSFDIEIETVCDPPFCFGLRCDKCVTDHTTTLYSNTDTSIPSSDSTVYIEPDKTTAPSSINITSGHITPTQPISTTVNQSSLATGSDAIIVITSSVVGFVLLVGILLGIAYKYKSKKKLRNRQDIQATKQLPPAIVLHKPENYGKGCLENCEKSNEFNNRKQQTQLTQDIDDLLSERDIKSEKQNNYRSENSSCKIGMDDKQKSQHINGRSAIANTRSSNNETQETLSVNETEQQKNDGHSCVIGVKDISHKPAKTSSESTTCEKDRNFRTDFVIEPKSTTVKTNEPNKSDGIIGSLLPPETTEKSYENNNVKRPNSAMPAKNRHMSKVDFPKSKSTLETMYNNIRPKEIPLQVNNLMPKNGKLPMNA